MFSPLARKQRKGKQLANRLSSESLIRPTNVDKALAPCNEQTKNKKISTHQPVRELWRSYVKKQKVPVDQTKSKWTDVFPKCKQTSNENTQCNVS